MYYQSRIMHFMLTTMIQQNLALSCYHVDSPYKMKIDRANHLQTCLVLPATSNCAAKEK